MVKSNGDSLAGHRAWICLAAALAAALGGWISPSAARAQIGASPEVMLKIYGPVLRHNARVWHGDIYDTNELDGDIYRHGDTLVRAAFFRGKVVLTELCGVGRLLTQKDTDAFLSLNSEGSRWELGKDSSASAKYYRRADDGAIAQWAVGENGSLLVSAEHMHHLEDKLLQ